MAQNEFAGTLYRTKYEMLDGIAYEYMTAGGLNSSEQIDEILEYISPEDAADEAIQGWELEEHMDDNGYTKEDLTDAMRGFIGARPDRDAI